MIGSISERYDRTPATILQAAPHTQTLSQPCLVAMTLQTCKWGRFLRYSQPRSTLCLQGGICISFSPHSTGTCEEPVTVLNLSNSPVSKPPQLRVCPPSQTPPTTMPHALSMASTGLQALILCGPGSSFPTFTSNPDENPKALLPIANRPMVWYPIDFCLRTGITSKRTSLFRQFYYFPFEICLSK